MDLHALGVRLKQAREQADLAQGEAAHEADIDVGTLSKYELGKVAEPSLVKIDRLAKLYGVRVEWLVSGVLPMTTSAGETRVERDTFEMPGVTQYFQRHPQHAQFRERVNRLLHSYTGDVSASTVRRAVRFLEDEDEAAGERQ